MYAIFVIVYFTCTFKQNKITSHLPVLLLKEKKSFDRADSSNNRVKIYILIFFSAAKILSDSSHRTFVFYMQITYKETHYEVDCLKKKVTLHTF